MSTQRYTPEFKEEAVRQVVDKDDPVTRRDVSQKMEYMAAGIIGPAHARR
jgi:transposase-like protein